MTVYTTDVISVHRGLIENIFRTLSEKCTANEIRWVARIILKGKPSTSQHEVLV